MAILAYTDFIGDVQLSIPNLKLTEFNTFLATQQEKFLRSVMGAALYNSFLTGWNVTSPEVPESKWTDLINGCDYTYLDELYHFDGLKSGLKYWSYCEWLRQISVINTGVANVDLKTENSENGFPVGELVLANNNCYSNVLDADFFITEKGESVYANYLFTNPVKLINTFGI